MADWTENSRYAEQVQKRGKIIGSAKVTEATHILEKYRNGKRRLESKIVKNEEFWKLRQWRYEDDTQKGERNPATPWLWSCIQSRYSDVMDSYPTCNIRPRQADDQKEAKRLSSILPVILEQNRYEEVYSQIALYTLKNGTGVHGIFWDKDKHNGLGDITIKKIDILNLFWEPGITDIQKSSNVFHTELVNNEILEQMYPECKGRLGGSKITVEKYLYDDTVDTSGKSTVVDWYYKKIQDGKQVLHYVKYVNDIVLFATENDEKLAKTGWYEHGLYPFVVQPLFEIEGSICGYGYTDIGQDTQLEIDKLNLAIVKNALQGASPRYFAKKSCGVNLNQYTDMKQDIVEVEGNLSDDNIRPIETKQMSTICVEVMNQKIEELKYCTSNLDSNNGVAPSGVTAASAIAALQETAGKNARSANKTFHRGFREVVYQMIELIRQFYTTPRTFRICPENAEPEFVEYTNKGLVPQTQETVGMDMGLRVPEFDVEVTSEKANPYKKMETNELALNFYSQGFFNPEMADQAISCLKMMDFTRKDEMLQLIGKNAKMQKDLLLYQQMALQLAQQLDPAIAQQIGQAILSEGGQPLPAGGSSPIEIAEEEHPYVEKARSQARASTEAE